MIETERLILRDFRDEDRDAFAALNADPEIYSWLSGPISRAASDAMVDRIRASIAEHGFGFWAVERKSDGAFLGFDGLERADDMPFGPVVEIGWRLARSAWGAGYATEAARAALAWGFAHLDVDEIVSFTARGNVRSEAVMRRIGMRRDPNRDFEHPKLPEGHPLRSHIVYAMARPAKA